MAKLFRLFLLSCIAATAQAHNPDTSYLRCVVGKHALELRFTFDIATLFRMAKLDVDGDGRVTPEELARIAPVVFEYVERSVPVEINDAPVGSRVCGEVSWPPDAGEFVLAKDFHQVLVHFPVRLESDALIEDFYVNYEVFEELGTSHRVVADIEQDGAHHEVIFNQLEPDYVYDTGWVAGIAKEANGQNAAVRFRESFRAGVSAAWNHPWIPLLLMLAAGLAFTCGLRALVPATIEVILLIHVTVMVWLKFSATVRHQDDPAAFITGSAAGLGISGILLLPAFVLTHRTAALFKWARTARAGADTKPVR